MYRVARELSFCYGHRLLDHDGKERQLHGHNARVFITLAATTLDKLGMVMDFMHLKRIVGGWIDQTLDHTLLLQRDDPLVSLLREQGERVHVLDEAPTAHAIARLIHDFAVAQEFPVVEVQLWETDTAYATYSAPR
jgi:6-pyruvoyltetrahydropterin/6-carboxytetrahydropterin synthase